jgi:hypothetical protein
MTTMKFQVHQLVWSDTDKKDVWCRFEVEVDAQMFAKSHGAKARDSKGKKCVEAGGALKISYAGEVK